MVGAGPLRRLRAIGLAVAQPVRFGKQRPGFVQPLLQLLNEVVHPGRSKTRHVQDEPQLFINVAQSVPPIGLAMLAVPTGGQGISLHVLGSFGV